MRHSLLMYVMIIMARRFPGIWSPSLCSFYTGESSLLFEIVLYCNYELQIPYVFAYYVSYWLHWKTITIFFCLKLLWNQLINYLIDDNLISVVWISSMLNFISNCSSIKWKFYYFVGYQGITELPKFGYLAIQENFQKHLFPVLSSQYKL